jgi:hypothetical protein
MQRAIAFLPMLALDGSAMEKLLPELRVAISAN